MAEGGIYTDVNIERAFCKGGLLDFTRYMFRAKTGEKYIVGEHHRQICDALDDVMQGRCRRLIINIAPRYGKTELAVKSFVAMGLAINPKAKFIHLSYSDDLVLDNSKAIQEMISADFYQRLFPEVVPTSHNTKKWYTSAGGGLYAVSAAGQVTGFGAGLVDAEMAEFEGDAGGPLFGGAIIIDDPIKPEDALSETMRERVNNRFETTIRNRVNSRRTPIVVIMQRLHEHDLCGYLMQTEPDEWRVLSLPCIVEQEGKDPAPLWPHKHTLDELRQIERANSFVFETQYMQNPKPLEGLMYSEFRTYDQPPAPGRGCRRNYTDTADTGADWLCSICYIETEIGIYITDVLYTKKPMEYTEPATAQLLSRNAVDVAVIESNNGGRSFARAVERELRAAGNTHTAVRTIMQRQNKAVRIFSLSANVQNLVYFPHDWARRWPDFHHDVTSYRKEGGNAHDDCVDALTGCVEMFRTGGTIDKARVAAMAY